MLSCKQVTELSSASLDGEVRGLPRLQMRLHMLICSHCRRFARHMRRSRETGAAIARALWQNDADDSRKILQRLREATRSSDQDSGNDGP